ncbi:MAG TPA: o-succinylbenzoate--CoA ligase [Marmoricola sp.]|nr:o-succinylbenzoate--CoA ligase [Marmoricola sp.]
MARRRPSEAADPVAAVLEAHEAGEDLLLGTSGTTSRSRDVVRSTASWWSSFGGYSELSGVDRGARLWLPGPLTATMNLFAAVHARVAGAVPAARPEQATHACLTPAVLAARGDELAPGTRVVVAGDALTPALHERFADRLVIGHYYGAAELSFVARGPHAGELRAFPGVDVTIRDGEILVRSPYLARPGSGSLRTVDGWATVGDLGRLDGDRLVVLGRPDAVVTGGATVPLGEAEEALAPAAAAPYALLGVPHPDLGAVLAAVVTDADDRERMLGYARERLPAAQRPRLWRVAEQLPLTDAGKVDRVALAELFRSDR